jgi:hypothetical protein
VGICVIRYRFDGPGPASFLVEHGGMLRVYCRGVLSAPLSEDHVTALLSDPKRHWVAASGQVVIELEGDDWAGMVGPLAVDAGIAAETA